MSHEPSQAYSASELPIPQAVVIDFDRTIGDVEACLSRFYAVALPYGVTRDQIETAKAAVEDEGKVFDHLGFLQNILSSKLREQFYEDFLSKPGPTVLYPDALPFLKKLRENGVPYHILTYGINEEWQKLKLKASGYEGGRTILNHIDKSKHIMNWRAHNGLFNFSANEGVAYLAKSICLIDDKVSAFKNFPQDCMGYLIRRSEVVLPSQWGTLPENVKIIKNLTELNVSEGVVVTVF